MATLSIIIPAYNEEKRLLRTLTLLYNYLKSKEFLDLNAALRDVLLVDDGSSDQTQNLALDYAKNFSALKILPIHPNHGKGFAIHAGLQASQADWCLIADADTATPWNQFSRLWKKSSATSPGQPDIVIGSRAHSESQIRVRQSWLREHMGKSFNFLVRMITGLPFKDTQCGFKLLNRNVCAPFFPFLKIERFSWDVEFLLFAQKSGIRIGESPIIWEHQEASRVHAFKDSMEMLFRIILLRVRVWLWKKN